MADTYDFPEDLLEAQQELHQVRHELSALYGRLPRYTDGWRDEDRSKVGALLDRDLALAVFVSTHAFWDSLEGPTRVTARAALKHVNGAGDGTAAEDTNG
ncbi:hypothetical protein [Streptomyces sp. NPDC047108]|uniref:hypothetical protein n=1 Tax=Streptomyces sp. NPDC047108 TaxID=3155025 RepID=UPI0033C055B7